MKPRWLTIFQWFGFNLVWMACAMGAARGSWITGVSAASVYLAVVLWLHASPARMGLLMLACGAVGVGVEGAMATLGAVRFAASSPSIWAAPLWLVAMWVAFAATLPSLAELLHNSRAVKAPILGAIAGPLAYWAGVRLGALDITGHAWSTYATFAIIWAIGLPVLLVLTDAIRVDVDRRRNAIEPTAAPH